MQALRITPLVWIIKNINELIAYDLVIGDFLVLSRHLIQVNYIYKLLYTAISEVYIFNVDSLSKQVYIHKWKR